MKKLLLSVASIVAVLAFSGVWSASAQNKKGDAPAQREVRLTLHNQSSEKQVIPKEIYGQFAEHLGRCIYGGIWVGENSPIPNQKGYRVDVLEALKALKVPVLRWPGGCFADEYHWMDGIGPYEKRPKMVNTNWGGTVEDNSFGTHEFLNFCELLGCEPYVNGNVGSGSVEEMAKWVEYMTSDADSPMANLRRENGRDKPWKVKYFGVGNENWGCGGNMRPEYYSDVYRRYATFCKNYSGNQLYKIACGASDYDYRWTDVLMSQVGRQMHGLSLHYYSVMNWDRKGSATQFNPNDWYAVIGKCAEIDSVIKRHCDIMDEYDPRRQIDMILDEWGTWWDEEPGTVRGHLYQQNTLRDAMVAAVSLNIFHKYTYRLKMANIAQMINVLQSMILTRDDEMILTPTYHLFKMYVPHQDATFVPMHYESESIRDVNRREVELFSATASRKDGVVTLSLVNVDLEKECKVVVALDDETKYEVSGEILGAKEMNAYNTFEQPENVKIQKFDAFKSSKGQIEVVLPAKSVVTLTLK